MWNFTSLWKIYESIYRNILQFCISFTESRRNSIDILLKAAGYLDCAIQHVLPRLPPDLRLTSHEILSVKIIFVYLLDISCSLLKMLDWFSFFWDWHVLNFLPKLFVGKIFLLTLLKEYSNLFACKQWVRYLFSFSYNA